MKRKHTAKFYQNFVLGFRENSTAYQVETFLCFSWVYKNVCKQSHCFLTLLQGSFVARLEKYGEIMELIEAIENRRSIRRFKSRAIPKDNLYYLIELAMHAPSAGNLQDYQFIVCTNKDMIDDLPSCCMDQTWIATAPTVIVVCSQPSVQQNWYGPAGDGFARHNASAAAQNILLAAHDFGLGACWVSGFDTDKINHLFHIPEGVRIEAIIPIGYSDEEVDEITKKDLKTALFYDFYGQDVQDFEKVTREVALLRDRKFRHIKKQVQPKISSHLQTLKEKIKFPQKKSQKETPEEFDEETNILEEQQGKYLKN